MPTNMENSMRQREALILHYVGIAAKEGYETDPQVLESIRIEKREIAESLSLTPEEILKEAQGYLLEGEK